MSSTATAFRGIVKFKVKGQERLGKWQREAIRRGLDSPTGPPESLRFQCRIATDARENFERVELPDGSALTLHPRSNPQFGKNRDGLAYLTVTLTHDATGESFRVKWVGDAVPLAMQRVAVAHDEGRQVAPKTIGLNLAKAQFTPVHEANGIAHRSDRDFASEEARKAELRASGVEPRRRSRRQCARLTDADLPD
jgi:hypothetical protein